MADKGKTINWAGNDLVVNRIITGATKVGAGEIKVSDAITSGHIAGRKNVVDVTTAATYTITAAESGTLFLMNKASGIVFTLPAPAVGLYYDFQVNTSVTSNAYKWSTATQGTDFFNGQVLTIDTDTAASPVAHAGNGTTHDNISMNGTTTGGLIGTRLRIECVSSTLWTVSGPNMASGIVATPFATS